MYLSRVVTSLFILHTVVQSCVWWESPGGEKYELSCGMSNQPNCKFSAEYVTIKPKEIESKYPIESGFGDAHFDTWDVDIDLRCSFKPEILAVGNYQYQIAIVSAKDGNITHARIEFEKGEKSGSSWEIVKNESGRLKFVDEKIETSTIIIASKQQAGTVYVCLCPKQKYKNKTHEVTLKYLSASSSPSENEYSQSPAQYTVPVYSPCKESTCNDNKYENMQHCYEMTDKTSLTDFNSAQLRNMVKSCTKMNSVSKSWIREQWESKTYDFISREPKLVQKLHMLTSKSVAQQVCTLMPSVGDWWKISGDKSDMFDKHYKDISWLMNTKKSFPWFETKGEEFSAFLLLHGYNKRHNNKFVTRGKDHIKCTQHIEMLEAMKMRSDNSAKIHKFYAKTYPICIDDFEKQVEKDLFALSFNGVPAFYNSIHASFNQNQSDDLLVLRTPNFSIVTNMNKTYKQKKLDCSLYIWRRSNSINTNERTILTSENPVSEANGNSLFYTFNISKTLMTDGGTKNKYLVGCYVIYCGENCSSDGVVKKMQLKIEPKRVAHYQKIVKGNTSCEKPKNGWHMRGESDSCECVYQVSLCSPLKTLSSLRIPCPKDKPEKSQTTLIIVLYAIGALMLIATATVIFIHNYKPYKLKSPKAVPILLLLANEPTETPNNAEYFDSGSITEAPKSEENAASISTPIDGSKADVSSQK